MFTNYIPIAYYWYVILLHGIVTNVGIFFGMADNYFLKTIESTKTNTINLSVYRWANPLCRFLYYYESLLFILLLMTI